MGLALDEFQHYSRPVGAKQTSAVEAFVKALGSAGPEQKQKALQKLLFALFSQDKGAGTIFDHTVYWFLILHSFHVEGNLSRPGLITQYISAIVFSGRAAMYNQIQETMLAKKCGYFKYVISAHTYQHHLTLLTS